MASIYTQENLEKKTVRELREMCKKLKITGMSKKRKDIIISAILETKASKPAARSVSPSSGASQGHLSNLKKSTSQEPVTRAQFVMSSVLTKPGARPGDKCDTTISVSCGANQGDFPVVGKTVGAVAEFLREVLNVDRMAEPLVNGEKVDREYVLQTDDNLEFLKPAGKKG